MDADYRVALLALRVIVDHERGLKGTVLHDPVVWTVAYQALNKCGYLDKPIPAQETSPEPGMHRNQVIARARMAHGGKWPAELTSGVMFYEGMRVTREDFEHR